MFGSKGRRFACLFLLLAFLAVPAAGQEIKHLGAHRFGSLAEFQKVIDAKCTICHSRERVDKAIRARRDLDKIERTMAARGARLSAHDKEVLGAFWGTPLKGK